VARAGENADVGDLVKRLRVKLGAERVFRMTPVESEFPERVIKRVPAMANSNGGSETCKGYDRHQRCGQSDANTRLAVDGESERSEAHTLGVAKLSDYVNRHALLKKLPALLTANRV
jgi:hypothetical protein